MWFFKGKKDVDQTVEERLSALEQKSASHNARLTSIELILDEFRDKVLRKIQRKKEQDEPQEKEYSSTKRRFGGKSRL